MKMALKPTTTALLCAFGMLAISGCADSQFEDPIQSSRDAYITECLEARIGWRRGTNGFYDTTSAAQRVRLADLCERDFDAGRVDPVVQAVRDGELEVRGQIDPRYHPTEARPKEHTSQQNDPQPNLELL